MKLKRVGVMAQCCSKVNLVSCPDMKGSMPYPKPIISITINQSK